MIRSFHRRLAAGAILAVLFSLPARSATEIAAVEPPPRASFASAAITRGAELAAVGDCIVCHTATHGSPYAGGRAVETPFGAVWSDNITPDPATGIGTWSPAAFRRAMREGIDRQGRHLYPVLPYPHFIHATDEDLDALYAFVMTRQPVTQTTPPNQLSFPFSSRPLLKVWNALFLSGGVWQPEASQSTEWNRGAYLVDAVGHCGACHSPHNLLGAETGHGLSGGEAEGWYAPPLQSGGDAPAAWTVDALTAYLRNGFDGGHGAAAGPMTAVTHQLASVPDRDVRAMAVYIASMMPPPGNTAAAPPAPRAIADPASQALFAGSCGACHATDSPMMRSGAPSLALSTAVNGPSPRDVVRVILGGLPMREGHAGPYMPGFASELTDAQIAALAAYVRARYTDKPEWADIEATAREARKQGGGS
jgi:mono/diheme cytochrome c family protein